jgi:thiamine biosynthesis lipoprotein
MRPVLLPAQITMIAPPVGSALHRVQGTAMGTSWSVVMAAPVDAVLGVQAAIDKALAEVVAEMSHWEAGSDLSRYNESEAGSWHKLAPHFWTVLNAALQVASLSEGAYDPAAGALVDAWGFGASKRYDETGFVPPSNDAIAALMHPGRHGWRDIALRPDGQEAHQPGGIRLDLSAVAKGYAVDLVSHSLTAHGIRHHLIEVGGELRGEGMKPDAQPWWVEMEWPGAQAEAPPLLGLHGLSVATSGDYRRFFEHESLRHPHTIDPRCGRPLRHGLASVTVVHASCMMADALSTALSVMGLVEGMAFATRQGVAACFAQRETGAHPSRDQLVRHLSPAFEAMLDA